MTKHLRIFISSTFQDLQEYRQAVLTSILSLGEYGDDMLYWAADERDGATVSVERAKQSDVLILVLAHRYGYIPEGEKFSITEMEYQAARTAKIPVLAFFVDERIPWPPSLVEWEKRDKLGEFKQRVEKDVTRKVFDSPASLGAQVTQALAAFITRYKEAAHAQVRFSFQTLKIQSALDLKTTPDLAIHIGYAEDDLPLIMQIKRSREFPGFEKEIGRLIQNLGDNNTAKQDSILNVLRESLEKLGTEGLTKLHIEPVRMKDGSVQEMFIASSTLTKFFNSTFTTILLNTQRVDEQANKIEVIKTSRADHTEEYATASTTMFSLPSLSERYLESEKRSLLQSVGGKNRYLGISVLDGKVYSVGKQGEQWVEWRPFLFESIAANFPNAYFSFTKEEEIKGDIQTYSDSIFRIVQKYGDPKGLAPADIQFVLSRQSIAQIILQIANTVKEWHTQGKIHGDLKSANILLTKQGPTFIDEFSLSHGDIAPGWTPDWSPPEQILGEPLTYAADIYPFGKMISDLTAGCLVGEVRKFRAPPILSGNHEFDIFFNPRIYIAQESNFFNSRVAMREWTGLAQSCLRFEPSERPTAERFINKLIELLDKHPLQGEITLSIPNQILATTLLTGHDLPARVIRA